MATLYDLSGYSHPHPVRDAFEGVTVKLHAIHDLSELYHDFARFTGLNVVPTYWSNGGEGALLEDIKSGNADYDVVELLRFQIEPGVVANTHETTAFKSGGLQPAVKEDFTSHFGQFDSDPIVLAYRHGMYDDSTYVAEYATFEAGTDRVWSPPSTLSELFRQHRFLKSKGRNGLPLKIAASQWEVEFFLGIAANYVPEDDVTLLNPASQDSYRQAAQDILDGYGPDAFDADWSNTNWGPALEGDDFYIWWADRGSKFGSEWSYMPIPPKDANSTSKTYVGLGGWGNVALKRSSQSEKEAEAAMALVAHMASRSASDADNVGHRFFQTPHKQVPSAKETASITGESVESVQTYMDTLRAVLSKGGALRIPSEGGNSGWENKHWGIATQLQAFPSTGVLSL